MPVLGWKCQNRWRNLSSFYGILRPFDGVTPYRLEMQAKLPVDGAKDLYEFWGESLAGEIFSETDCVVNLASKEYSRCVTAYVPAGGRVVTCVFGERKDGKIIEKGTQCKMVRGEIVRYMAGHQIDTLEPLRDFDRPGYHFSAEDSGKDAYTFIKEPVGKGREA